MTESDCLKVGVAVSLFAHFLLLGAKGPDDTLHQPTRTVVHLKMDSPVVAPVQEEGLGVIAAVQQDLQDAKAADRKRQAFLEYLDAVDAAVHARRLDGGESGLIGVVSYVVLILPDGNFAEPRLRRSSGDPRLDAAAARAIRAASGKVKRPRIIGLDPINVILEVKYQYGLR